MFLSSTKGFKLQPFRYNNHLLRNVNNRMKGPSVGYEVVIVGDTKTFKPIDNFTFWPENPLNILPFNLIVVPFVNL